MVRRAAKWLLCSGLVLVALVLAAIMSLPHWAGPLIARYAAATLGRSVTIGRVDLHLGAPVTVVVADVVIGNPDGFAVDQPFARIPRLIVGIDVAASFHHRTMVLASVEIDQPAIDAIETEDGRGNYHLPSSSSTPVGSLSIISGRARVSLARVHADFEVTFATERAIGSTDTPSITGEARGTYAGEPMVARFAGSLPSSWQPSRPWPVEIAIRNGPTQVSLK